MSVQTSPPSLRTFIVSPSWLFESLYGDCAYFSYASLEVDKRTNCFQLNEGEYWHLVNWIRPYITSISSRSWKYAYSQVSKTHQNILSAVAYRITAARIELQTGQSLEPYFSPSVQVSPVVQARARQLFAFLEARLLPELISIVVAYAVDPRPLHHKRCVKLTTEGYRCVLERRNGSVSCGTHPQNLNICAF